MGSIVAKAGSTVAVVTFFDISTVDIIMTFIKAMPPILGIDEATFLLGAPLYS